MTDYEKKKRSRELMAVIGEWLQRSPIISFLMVLLVFAAAVFLLGVRPQSDLPLLEKGSLSPQEIKAEFDFSYVDKGAARQVYYTFALEAPRYFRRDKDRSDRIMSGYELVIQEVQRERDRIAAAPPGSVPPSRSPCGSAGGTPVSRFRCMPASRCS